MPGTNNSTKPAALVTGASSGIGLAIAMKLASMGYEVYGMGRNFMDETCSFTQVPIDLLDTNSLTKAVKEFSKAHSVQVLVNCAGTAYYGLFEEIKPLDIQEMVRVNLEVPMLLTNLLLRDLKKNKGYIINVSSVTATSSNPHGVCYGATKAGLSSFSKSLFDEARKYGLQVCDIKPDMTQTNLYRNANFCAEDDLQAALVPEDVANAVEWILTNRHGLVVNEITLKPQLHRLKKKL